MIVTIIRKMVLNTDVDTPISGITETISLTKVSAAEALVKKVN